MLVKSYFQYERVKEYILIYYILYLLCMLFDNIYNFLRTFTILRTWETYIRKQFLQFAFLL